MNKKELKFISQEGEGFKIEFKESLQNIGKEMAAFANGAGGRIFLGVDDRFETNEFFRTVFYRPKETKKSGKKFGENQRKILELISENPSMPIPQIADKLGLTTRAIEKNIAKLKQKGLLKRIGPAKGGYWKIVKK